MRSATGPWPSGPGCRSDRPPTGSPLARTCSDRRSSTSRTWSWTRCVSVSPACSTGGCHAAAWWNEFTSHLVTQLGEERWSAMSQYALLNEAARQPELEQVCREWNEGWRELLTEVFTSLGAPEPGELEAKMFLAMLDGLLLAQLAVPDEDVENSVIRPALKAWFARVPSATS